MSWFSIRWQQLRNDDAGAVTVDWVALTAGALLLGVAAVYAVYSRGVGPMADEVGRITISSGDIDVQPIPDINSG